MDFESTTRPAPVSPSRLWFGVVVSGACWFLVGLAEMFITWRACMHNEQFGNASSHPAATAASFAVSFFLLGLVATAGFVSYRDWRRLSKERSLLEAEGREHHAFLALMGVLLSITLGAGMVWISLPLFFLRLCVRMR